MYFQLTKEKILTDTFNITFTGKVFFIHNKQAAPNENTAGIFYWNLVKIHYLKYATEYPSDNCIYLVLPISVEIALILVTTYLALSAFLLLRILLYLSL